jgi:hypothetical protein
MPPLVWLDSSLAILGMMFVAAAIWRRRRPQRPSLGTVLMFFVGVGQLAAAAVDVGLAEWEKSRRPGDYDPGDDPPYLVKRLSAGEPAPDFSLPSLKDGRPLYLSDFRDRKPVLLIFGSFT